MQLIMPKFWLKKNAISYFLYPFSFVYDIILRLVFIVKGMNVYDSSAKIITIGNVNMGGVGKTPVTIAIAKFLKNNSKKKIAVLTRGYLGKEKGPKMVFSNAKSSDFGDEAVLLSNYVDTCMAKNRLAGIKYLEKAGYEIIITDDGLQDARFKKDLAILVIDGEFGVGNGMIFPAGPLRQSLSSALCKVDYCISIGKCNLKIDEKKLVLASVEAKVNLDNNKFIAFAGIGRPEKFFKSVALADGVILEKIEFGDHHQYSDEEIENLIKLARIKKADLITTEKDYTRINEKYRQEIKTLPIAIIWNNEEILNKILSLA